MNFRDSISQLGRALDAALLGSTITLTRANRKLLDDAAGASPEQFTEDRRLAHEMSVLTATREDSLRRLQRIEDKAKGTIVGVGIAVTVIGSAIAFLPIDGPLATSGGLVRRIVAFLLVTTVVFLLLSGHFALLAYAVGEVYAPTLEDLPPLASQARAKSVEVYSLEQNQRIGTVRANYLSASFTSLRNGIVLLAMIGLALFAVSSISSTNAPVAPSDKTRREVSGPNHPDGGHQRSVQQWNRADGER